MENNFDFQQNIVSGKEQYKCSVTKDEFIQIYNIFAKRQKRFAAIFSAVIVIVSLLFLPLEYVASASMLTFGLLYIIIFLINFYKIRKDWIDRSLEIENKFQIVDVFDDKISISVIDNNELTKKHSIVYENIINLDDKDGYFIFADRIHVFYIKKNIINDNSILFDKFSNIKAKAKKNNKLIYIGLAILMLSFFLVMLTPLLINSAALILGNPCLWIYFAVIPIPLSSIIFSFVLKKHKLKYLASLLMGIIVCVFLVINGLGQIGYNKFYGDGYNIISETEEKLGIKMPIPDNIEFYKDSFSDDSRINIINDVVIEYYESEYVENGNILIDDMLDNDIWLDEMPDSFFNVVPYPEYYSASEYFILYNIDTKDVNVVPKDKGEYRLVFISYYFGEIDIVEYSITL